MGMPCALCCQRDSGLAAQAVPATALRRLLLLLLLLLRSHRQRRQQLLPQVLVEAPCAALARVACGLPTAPATKSGRRQLVIATSLTATNGVLEGITSAIHRFQQP